ncbi:hypothetical protein ACHHYP_02211 [Achlya hypogyna]|uniref:HTH CENPB-type domain-containing protein n=1 Tax=Achlya hypogyna TaxID=1202772 RepID=A0A1V9Z784_ACHHY|nr:hypothetical protein ACHHYP_02211 [Achlya hypogyna]
MSFPPEPESKRRGTGARLTDEQRMEVLDKILQSQAGVSGAKIPTKALADEYGVTPAAIRKLYKNRDVFLARFATGRDGVRNGRKRGGDRSKVDFETELYKWITALRANNVALVPSHIQQRALIVAKKYPDLDKFQASWGWYYRFCNRYNVTGALAEPAPYEPELAPDAAMLAGDDDSAMAFLVGLPKRKPRKKPDASDETLLLQATIAGDLGAVETLVKKGANIECLDQDGCTPLLVALKTSHFPIVKYLLEQRAKPDVTDETGTSALLLAVKLGHVHAVKCLLEANANAEATDNNLKTALFVASEMGDTKIVKLLLKFGANLEATDVDDCTPLFGAVRFGRAKVVDVLVKRGANRLARSLDGMTPVELAQTLAYDADMLQSLDATF